MGDFETHHVKPRSDFSEFDISTLLAILLMALVPEVDLITFVLKHHSLGRVNGSGWEYTLQHSFDTQPYLLVEIVEYDVWVGHARIVWFLY